MNIFMMGFSQHVKAQHIKNAPAMQEVQETWVQSLDWEDPLEKEMATIPVLLLEKIHVYRSLASYSPMDYKELDSTVLST